VTADGVEEDIAEEGTPSETEADSITLLEKQLEEAVVKMKIMNWPLG